MTNLSPSDRTPPATPTERPAVAQTPDSVTPIGSSGRGSVDSLSQRQDSLADQMATVCELAVAHGCYDAHMWISRRFYGEIGDLT